MSDHKPGTVAVATVRGVPNVRVFRVVVTTDPRWIAATRIPGEAALQWDTDVADVRPLVVLDPEGVEDREWFRQMAINYIEGDWSTLDCLRSRVQPSKPDEPSGRYAVVEDQAGQEWVAIDGGRGGFRWQLLGQPNAASCYMMWDSLNVARILSDGVRP